jgi:hypothetical protein
MSNLLFMQMSHLGYSEKEINTLMWFLILDLDIQRNKF